MKSALVGPRIVFAEACLDSAGVAPRMRRSDNVPAGHRQSPLAWQVGLGVISKDADGFCVWTFVVSPQQRRLSRRLEGENYVSMHQVLRPRRVLQAKGRGPSAKGSMRATGMDRGPRRLAHLQGRTDSAAKRLGTVHLQTEQLYPYVGGAQSGSLSESETREKTLKWRSAMRSST